MQLEVSNLQSLAIATAIGFLIGFQREWRNERTLVLINYGTEAAELSVPSLPPAATAQRIWPRNSASLRADHNGTARAVVPAQTVAVYRVGR